MQVENVLWTTFFLNLFILLCLYLTIKFLNSTLKYLEKLKLLYIKEESNSIRGEFFPKYYTLMGHVLYFSLLPGILFMVSFGALPFFITSYYKNFYTPLDSIFFGFFTSFSFNFIYEDIVVILLIFINMMLGLVLGGIFFVGFYSSAFIMFPRLWEYFWFIYKPPLWLPKLANYEYKLEADFIYLKWSISLIPIMILTYFLMMNIFVNITDDNIHIRTYTIYRTDTGDIFLTDYVYSWNEVREAFLLSRIIVCDYDESCIKKVKNFLFIFFNDGNYLKISSDGATSEEMISLIHKIKGKEVVFHTKNKEEALKIAKSPELTKGRVHTSIIRVIEAA